MSQSEGDHARRVVRMVSAFLPLQIIGIRIEMRMQNHHGMHRCAVLEVENKKSIVLRIFDAPSAIRGNAKYIQSRLPQIPPENAMAISTLLVELGGVAPLGAWPLWVTKKEDRVLSFSGLDPHEPGTEAFGHIVQDLASEWPGVAKIDVTVQQHAGSIIRREWIEAFDNAGQTLLTCAVANATMQNRFVFGAERLTDEMEVWRHHSFDDWAAVLSVTPAAFAAGFARLSGLVSIVQPTRIRLRYPRGHEEASAGA